MKTAFIFLTFFSIYRQSKLDPEISHSNIEFDSVISKLFICKDSNLLALLADGTIFKKSNEVSDRWNELTTKLVKLFGSLKIDQSFIEKKVGMVMTLIQSPSNKDFFFIKGTDEYNWITTDCGESFEPLLQFKKINEINIHPMIEDWILISTWTECKRIDKTCFVSNELYFTKDKGKMWTKIKSYVVNFQW